LKLHTDTKPLTVVTGQILYPVVGLIAGCAHDSSTVVPPLGTLMVAFISDDHQTYLRLGGKGFLWVMAR